MHLKYTFLIEQMSSMEYHGTDGHYHRLTKREIRQLLK